MENTTSYPLVLRGAEKNIEIPARFQELSSIKDITRTNIGRLSREKYTVNQVQALLEVQTFSDATNKASLHLVDTIKVGYSTIVQLIAHKRWRIICLIDLVHKGWSGLETTTDGQTGIFHTGSRMHLGYVSEQYLIGDNHPIPDISTMTDIQRRQPDIIAWRDKTF